MQEWNGCGIGIGTLVTSCRRSSSSSARCALRARVTSCPCSAIHVPFCVFIIVPLIPKKRLRLRRMSVSGAAPGLRMRLRALRACLRAPGLLLSQSQSPTLHTCSMKSPQSQRASKYYSQSGPRASRLWVPPRKCPLSLSLVSRSHLSLLSLSLHKKP